MNRHTVELDEFGLSKREHDVLNAIVMHDSNKRAAQALKVSHRMIEKHVSRIYTKLVSRQLIPQRTRPALLVFWIKHAQ